MGVSLNIFSLHYFLWFSAITSIYGFVSVYAEHYANVSSSQFGLLNMILPFISILSRVYFCSLADRLQAWRSSLIWFLIAALIGYGSFGVLPFFIDSQPKDMGLNLRSWVFICIMNSVAQIAMSVIGCLSDAFAMNSSKRNRTSYGFIRLWGTLGWGLASSLLAFINQYDGLPMLVPGIFLLIVLLVLDILAVIYWPSPEDFRLNESPKDECEIISTRTITSELSSTEKNRYGSTNRDNDAQRSNVEVSDLKIQWILFREVVNSRKSILRYMILFTITGALISMQWLYFFLFLNQIYESDFTFISGLSMVSQSMFGELPFFILSDTIVKALGRPHTLSLSIASLGVRYLLYHFLLPNSSMYLVLLTEAFQGPSFGLFYVVMTDIGLDYSNCNHAILKVLSMSVNNSQDVEKLSQLLRATMQSLMSACYEGLGMGIGSIIGGLIIDNYGFGNLWLWTACTALLVALMNSLIETRGCMYKFT